MVVRMILRERMPGMAQHEVGHAFGQGGVRARIAVEQHVQDVGLGQDPGELAVIGDRDL